MSQVLELTPHDPLIARDGRPFGEGQGNRMRGLPWPLPSVVAGSFRTALVKANPDLDFTWRKLSQEDLLKVKVAGLFPVHDGKLYLPAPLDCVAEPTEDKKGIKATRAVRPVAIHDCCDMPHSQLQPVMLLENVEDFKPTTLPAWWPVAEYAKWLVKSPITINGTFLMEAKTDYRDHVKLGPDTGAAEEGQIFSTANLSVTHLRRYVEKLDDKGLSFDKKFAQITLATRVQIENGSLSETPVNFWHPLGGERRLVHWQECQEAVTGWTCPDEIHHALTNATKIRMVLATPAIFANGWKPGWLDEQLEGTPPGYKVKLKLVGVCNSRWKAISGWDLQKHGPKPIRRMVPAGSVYFFTTTDNALSLSDFWLQSVCDHEQDQRDGFGLALWGTW